MEHDVADFQKIRQVPKILALVTLAGRTITFHIIFMAIHKIGNVHSGTSSTITRPGKILLVLTDYFLKWVEVGAYL